MNLNKNLLSQQLKESPGCLSICTKCSLSYKTSSSPEGDTLKKVGTVDELSCDCEDSHNEHPAPLDFNMDSKAILQSIRRKRSAKTPSKSIKLQLNQLKEQIKILNFRAGNCEGELRVKEKEISELKDIMIGLKKNLQDQVEDKVDQSTCQACLLF
jgi:hypothetical protein